MSGWPYVAALVYPAIIVGLIYLVLRYRQPLSDG